MSGLLTSDFLSPSSQIEQHIDNSTSGFQSDSEGASVCKCVCLLTYKLPTLNSSPSSFIVILTGESGCLLVFVMQSAVVGHVIFLGQ